MEALTFAEAKALSEQYSRFVGTVVLNEEKEFEVIDHIVVCPYSKINRLLFFQLFQELKCPEKALAFYKQAEYDTFVVLRELIACGQPYKKYIDLRHFLQTMDASANVISYRTRAEN